MSWGEPDVIVKRIASDNTGENMSICMSIAGKDYKFITGMLTEYDEEGEYKSVRYQTDLMPLGSMSFPSVESKIEYLKYCLFFLRNYEPHRLSASERFASEEITVTLHGRFAARNAIGVARNSAPFRKIVRWLVRYPRGAMKCER